MVVFKGIDRGVHSQRRWLAVCILPCPFDQIVKQSRMALQIQGVQNG